MDFKDRQQELSEIQELLDSPKFEFLILYGRRRIGKTELVLHSTKKRKRIYYLATTENNLERFYNECAAFDPKIATLKKDFEVIFDHLKDKADVIIIDEFQNMIKENKNIVSVFQSIVDTKLKKSKVKLILLGSSISIMTSKVMSYQSPLYGRRTASIKLKPVSFPDLKEFFPNSNSQELAEIYGFADGIPFYLTKVEKDFWIWLEEEIKKEKSFLRDEVDFLMRYEFDNPSTYRLILEAIANGKTKINEIKNFIHAKRTDVTPYIRNLCEVELIKRQIPITENQNSRNGRYYLNDNFLTFWFRFIYPNLSSIEARIFDTKKIREQYPAHMGLIFEQIARQHLTKNPPFKISKIGKWWHKDEEIDIIALDETKKQILFAECKWKENVNPHETLQKLKQKATKVQWNNQNRKEHYTIYAKTFKPKTTQPHLTLIELKNINKTTNKNPL